MGSGLNYISYFCKDCGGIAHFARHDNRNIETFTINYYMGEKANRKTSNEETTNHWLDDLPPMGCKNYIYIPRGMRLPSTCPSCGTKMENGGERF